jgi:hypothetical protein
MLVLKFYALHEAMYHTMYMVRPDMYVSLVVCRRDVSGAGSMYPLHQLLLDRIATIPNLISSSQLLDCCASRIYTIDPVTKVRNSQTLFTC